MGFLRSTPKRAVGARAQLTTFHDSKLLTGSVNPGGSGKSLHSVFVMRVTPENGEAEFESQMSVWGNDADRLQAGRWTYVLDNPEKPDTCDLDKDRLAKEFGVDRHGHPVMVPRDVSNGWFHSGSDGSAAASSPEPEGKDDRMARMMALASDPAARQKLIQEQMAASAPAAAAPPRPDITEQLSKLADLRDRGVLSEAEFAAEKAKLLAAS
jgi:Short C-terminal domain